MPIIARKFQWVVLLLLSVFLWYCGIKAPPKPPRQKPPPAVNDLQFTISNNAIDLRWTVPHRDRQKFSPPAAFIVYRSKIALVDGNCGNCPLDFQPAAKLSVAKARAKDSQMAYADKLEKGYQYVFKVICVSDQGRKSADSSLIKLEHGN